MLLQIQEMLRTERISSEDGIAHEMETYNELVPGELELSMTLFIEIDDETQREKMLTQLAGMESHVYLELDGERFATRASDRDGAEAGRTTAVQYQKVPLSSAAATRLRDGQVATVVLGVDHPAYRQRVELAVDIVAQLKADLSWSS